MKLIKRLKKKISDLIKTQEKKTDEKDRYIENIEVEFDEKEAQSKFERLKSPIIYNYNEIIAFSDEELKQVKFLDCGKCDITDLNFLRKMSNIVSLDISYNGGILDLTPLENLTSLQVLNLNQCYRARNHKALLKLTKLVELNVKCNQIEDVKEFIEILFHENMKKLYISKSPVHWREKNIHTHIPKELLDSSSEEQLFKLRAFFKELRKGSQKNQDVKVVVIGNGSVGKTQITRRLCIRKDFTFNEEHDSTHGITLMKAPINDLNITFWDFAGQDIYHSTHRVFMQTRALFLLVWDIKNESNIHHFHNDKKYKNEKIVYWLEYAKFLGQSNSILVAQNKVDKESDREKKYLGRTIKKFRSHYSVSEFIQVSAKSGYNFDVLKHWIYESFKLNYSFKRELFQKLPISWIKVREKIFCKQKNKIKTISLDEFDGICRLNGIKEDYEVLLEFLHNSGVLFFQKQYLGSTIVLDQAWAIEAIYKVLDREAFYYRLGKPKKGKLFYKDFQELWKEYSNDTVKLFLGMMLRAELCFYTDAEKEYEDNFFIIPQLLPEQKPKEVDFWNNEKNISQYVESLEFKFLPSLFIHRFIVRADKYFNVKFMWENGVLIQSSNGFSIIEANYLEKEILIKYNDANLYKSILKEFYDITNKSTTVYRKLKMISEEMYLNFRYFNTILQNKNPKIKASLKQKLMEGKINIAIQMLIDFANDTRNKDLESECIFISCKLQMIENQIRTGIINHENASIEKNKILTSTIQLVDSINSRFAQMGI